MKFLIQKLKKLIKWYKHMRDTDPVNNCQVYLKDGCSHVDGFLCEFETCSTRLEYLSKGKNE